MPCSTADLWFLVHFVGFIANIILRAKAVGHPVAEWPYPLEPQMLVSGISMISVASLIFGFKNGGIIGFWVRARRGMSVSFFSSSFKPTKAQLLTR